MVHFHDPALLSIPALKLVFPSIASAFFDQLTHRDRGAQLELCVVDIHAIAHARVHVGV